MKHVVGLTDNCAAGAHGHTQRSGAKSDVIEDVVVREIHHTRQLPKD
jgi:hypothetical protein